MTAADFQKSNGSLADLAMRVQKWKFPGSGSNKKGRPAPSTPAVSRKIRSIDRATSDLSICANRAAFAQSSASFARLYPCFERESNPFAWGNPRFSDWHVSCIRKERVMNLNATLHVEQPMNTTILNYPGFQTLPKGVRQMLLVSEAYFFNEPASDHQEQKVAARRANRGSKDFMAIPFLPAGFALDVPA